MMKKAIRARLFLLAVAALVCIPTALAVYLTVLKKSGGIADRVAQQIAKGIGMPVKLADVEFPRLDLEKVVLKGLSIPNPLRSDYPFFESDEVVVDGFSTSTGTRADSITIRSYAMALPVGRQDSSGESLRSVAGTIVATFLDRSFVRKVTLDRGRLILVLGGKDVTIGIARGQIAVSGDGKSVSGEVQFDALSGADFSSKLIVSISGDVKAPTFSLTAECHGVALSRIASLGIFPLPDGAKVNGQGDFSLSYSAGQSAKDAVTVTGQFTALQADLDKTGSITVASLKVSAKYESEKSTYPDVERIIAAGWTCETSAFTAKTTSGASLTFDTAQACVSLGAQTSVTMQSVKNLTTSISGREFLTQEVFLKGAFSGSAVTGELSAQFSDGSRLDVSGRLSDLFGEVSGHLRCVLYDLPQSFLNRVFDPSTVALEFAYEPLNGSVDINITGPKSANGSLALHTGKLVVKRNRRDLPGLEVMLSTDFTISDGNLESLRKTRLSLVDLCSFEGTIDFFAGLPSRISIDSLRLDAGFLSRFIAGAELGVSQWKFDGRVDIRGDISGFRDVFAPGSMNLAISVVDEFSVTMTSPRFSLTVMGVTGRITLMGREAENTRFYNISGAFLPQSVTVNSKKLFLSGQKVNASADLKYSAALDTLTVVVARLESDSGPREEITGDIRNLFVEPVLNLKFRDWGMTLQQLATLFEIPPGIKITSGNFVLERTLTGPLSSLESKYSVSVNDMSFETRRVNLEGADILIEFP